MVLTYTNLQAAMFPVAGTQAQRSLPMCYRKDRHLQKCHGYGNECRNYVIVRRIVNDAPSDLVPPYHANPAHVVTNLGVHDKDSNTWVQAPPAA